MKGKELIQVGDTFFRWKETIEENQYFYTCGCSLPCHAQTISLREGFNS
jgi:hypothetical protein